jgi:DNA polymerase-3 subunit alpha
MKYVEAAGLVKFDFLGLKTLSVLRKGVELLEQRGVHADLDALAWDDPEVYALLQRGDTVGVFQLESEGMRRTLAAVKPTSFEDIIALVSLYRPGPMDNIPLFGARKNGREAIEYPHPLLENVLSETYGIFVYQEQVMEAARVLAGYSLGEADLLRRAMGKKIQAEMDAQRSRFVEGCAANDIGAPKANDLFDLIDKFAGYGFNKSHAAAYALVAYQTAWLKAHYPFEFYAASMCFDMHQTDKLAIFVDDMRQGRAAVPAAVDQPQPRRILRGAARESHAVRYALGALKGVGEKAMEALAVEREEKGAFANLEDFAGRIDPRAESAADREPGPAPARSTSWRSAPPVYARPRPSSPRQQRGGRTHQRAGGPVRRRPGQCRAFPPGPGARLDDGRADGPGEGSVRLLFLRSPGRRFRALADAQGARTFAAIATAARRQTESAPRHHGGLVEEARWRTSQKGGAS